MPLPTGRARLFIAIAAAVLIVVAIVVVVLGPQRVGDTVEQANRLITTAAGRLAGAPALIDTPVPTPTSAPPPTFIATSTPTRVAPTPTPVPPSRKMVFTPYFYWYDSETGGHLNPVTLKNHLPATPAPNWRSVDWHKKELRDMGIAGIDVALPVYWGQSSVDQWSWSGLPVIASALNSLEAEGQPGPKIGMFFDTTIVGFRDLTTTDGKDFFYKQFRDFFMQIPSGQWATINGRPVAFLFTSDYTGAMNQSTFDHVYAQFTADFGIRPYIVREASWDHPFVGHIDERTWDLSIAIQTDNSYAWGSAIRGYLGAPGVVAVGPGYDDRGLPGREGSYTDREGGLFYAQAFWEAINSGKPLLFIETWNEVHEATGISETEEWGRFFITGTANGVALFKGLPTPTAISSATPTATVTLVATPTATATAAPVAPLATSTALPLSTPTPTAEPTATGTPTPAATATSTETSTASPTATATATPTPTASATPTPTESPVPTSTRTPTRTATAPPTAAAGPSPTETPTRPRGRGRR